MITSLRPSGIRIQRATKDLARHLADTRKLQRLTSQQVADRAGISRATLSRLENGKETVSLDTFLEVARALGILDRIVEAADPWQTDVGRLRAQERLPARVRPIHG